jgi:hypothetical protein
LLLQGCAWRQKGGCIAAAALCRGAWHVVQWRVVALHTVTGNEGAARSCSTSQQCRQQRPHTMQWRKGGCRHQCVTPAFLLLPGCPLLLQVHFQGSVASPEGLVAAVEDCGFDCRLQSVHNVDDEGEAEAKPQVGLKERSSSSVLAGCSRSASAPLLAGNGGGGG